jgi:hypothetical protein
VTAIGGYAFQNCSALPSIEIPSTVVTIGQWAFSGCSNLVRANLPTNLASLGAYAFNWCTSLIAIEIPPKITSIAEWTFNTCRALVDVSIPDGVTNIGSYAFNWCTSIQKLVVPSSVTSIGAYAFANCSLFGKIHFLGSAPATDNAAFTGSNSVTVYRFDDLAGFTTPTWKSRSVASMGPSSDLSRWALRQGYPFDVNFGWQPHNDGKALLLAYAFGLDSRRNFSSHLPKPEIANSRLNLRFYSGSPNALYTVQTSTDLIDWTTTGVEMSLADTQNFRTASVPVEGGKKFLRIVVSER